jgi:selenocysteine-specific elongation factor
MDAATLDAIVASIRQRLASQGTISLGELRDELSTSRKFAMQILEYCDEKKITRMEGDYRVSY